MKRIAVVSVIMMSLLSGCLWAPGLDSVRRELQAQLPGAHFDRQFAISLGPISLGLARAVTGMIDDKDAREARVYLKEVHKVKVAVYEAYDVPRDVRVHMPRKVREMLEHKGWEMAVKVRDEGEHVWILYKEKDSVVRNLFVIVLSEDQLVLVEADGRLDRLFRKAISEHMDLPAALGVDMN